MPNEQPRVRLSILIPCYNEEENIKNLWDQLQDGIRSVLNEYQVEIVFIDDGSSDGTWDALHSVFTDLEAGSPKIIFCRHVHNKGLGAAIRTGIQASHGDILVTTDSDGTYSFSEIPALVALMVDDVAIVSASPYHPRGGVKGVPPYRLILSRGSSFLYRLLVDWNIYTYTSLFRAYRREVFKDVEFSANDYLAGTEILVKARLLGYRIVEYPTVLRVRQFGTSKARIMETVRSHLIFQLRILVHRLGIHSLLRLGKEEPLV